MEEKVVTEEYQKPRPALLRPVSSKLAYSVIGIASVAVLVLLLALFVLN